MQIADSVMPARARLIPWLALGAGVCALAIAFAPSLALVTDAWFESEEYSHGMLMPIVGGYLLWQRRVALARLPVGAHVAGLPILAVALLLAAIGLLGATQALTQYACLLALAALVLATLGGQWLRALLFPLLLLALAIPLPAFLYNSLSLRLQLWSSDLGVAFIRLLGITVYQDGNVIDLGELKLQVAEACNGLRYLFPMISLSTIMAYLYGTTLLQRALLVSSALPIAILMNGLRIGIIGYLVEHHGPAIAEGFLHDLQGWAMFMVSFGVLFGVLWLLGRVLPGRHPRPSAVAVAATAPNEPIDRGVRGVAIVAATLAASMTIAAALTAVALPDREEAHPVRTPFTAFPQAFAGWHGETHRIDALLLRTLRLSDYLLADYRLAGPDAPGNSPLVNLYVAWYDSQRQGQAAHSPRSCLPGDGWEIASLDVRDMPPVGAVNRALIRKGDEAQLVYYWFAQRGRRVTNEYAVKWWLLVDAITRNRSDGALVRITTPLYPGESEATADARARDFLLLADLRLRRHLPD